MTNTAEKKRHIFIPRMPTREEQNMSELQRHLARVRSLDGKLDQVYDIRALMERLRQREHYNSRGQACNERSTTEREERGHRTGKRHAYIYAQTMVLDTLWRPLRGDDMAARYLRDDLQAEHDYREIRDSLDWLEHAVVCFCVVAKLRRVGCGQSSYTAIPDGSQALWDHYHRNEAAYDRRWKTEGDDEEL